MSNENAKKIFKAVGGKTTVESLGVVDIRHGETEKGKTYLTLWFKSKQKFGATGVKILEGDGGYTVAWFKSDRSKATVLMSDFVSVNKLKAAIL